MTADSGTGRVTPDPLDGVRGRVLPRWLCRLTFRHRGRVGYVYGGPSAGPFWICDSCGTVIR